MVTVTPEQLRAALRSENPWWNELSALPPRFKTLQQRDFLRAFHNLVRFPTLRREVVLLGPRRVGKTYLIHHCIAQLLAEGIPGSRILYVAVDNPLCFDSSLLGLLEAFQAVTGTDWKTETCYVFFDEIQYLKDWEQHLKSLHDSGFSTRFVVSGSAHAALGRGSRESGAGRFTDFILPPLTFAEFLHFKGQASLVEQDENGFFATDIEELNRFFLDYANFGGFPEIALSDDIRQQTVRYMRSDITDKVLLKDLPSLYGISDVRELHRLFTMLALNTGNELSLDKLSQSSAVAKGTIKKYIAYLESAFLIRVVTRINQKAGRFQRDHTFKVYLTNPSLRTGLFSPFEMGDEGLGHMVETVIFAQRFHRLGEYLHYARWKAGGKNRELDLVALEAGVVPTEAVEVKFTDRIIKQRADWRPWLDFCHRNNLENLTITTLNESEKTKLEGVSVTLTPSALYAYRTGLQPFLMREKERKDTH